MATNKFKRALWTGMTKKEKQSCKEYKKKVAGYKININNNVWNFSRRKQQKLTNRPRRYLLPFRRNDAGWIRNNESQIIMLPKRLVKVKVTSQVCCQYSL